MRKFVVLMLIGCGWLLASPAGWIGRAQAQPAITATLTVGTALNGETLTSGAYHAAAAATDINNPTWSNYSQKWYHVPLTAGTTYRVSMDINQDSSGGSANNDIPALSLETAFGTVTQVGWCHASSQGTGATAFIIYTPPAGGTGSYTVICATATANTNGATLSFNVAVTGADTPSQTYAVLLDGGRYTGNNANNANSTPSNWGGHQQTWQIINLSAGIKYTFTETWTGSTSTQGDSPLMALQQMAASGTAALEVACTNSTTSNTTVSFNYTVPTASDGTFQLIGSRTSATNSAGAQNISMTVAFSNPTITANSADLVTNSTTMTIVGTNFSSTAANNIVTFSGVTAVGTVTAATTTSLTITFTTAPATAGTLSAVVAVTNAGSISTPVQVATIAAPVAPILNSATASIGTVNLAWTAATSSDASTRYWVFRGTATASLTTLTPAAATTAYHSGLGTVAASGATYVGHTSGAGTVTFTDTYNITNGTLYYYAIVSAEGGNEQVSTTSSPSNTKLATPIAENAPTGVSVSTPSAGGATTTITWTGATGTTSQTVYYIFRATSSSSLSSITPASATTIIAVGTGNTSGNVTYVNNVTAASASSCTDGTLSYGVTYYYALVASDSPTVSSATSTISNIDSAIPGILTPTGLTAAATIGGVTLTWTAPTNSTANTRYFVFREVASSSSLAALSPASATTQMVGPVGNTTNNVTYVGQTTTAGVKSFTDYYNVGNGTDYHYAIVRGEDNGATASGTSNQSASASATPIAETAPTAVNATTPSTGGATATITWTASTSATASTLYYIFRTSGSATGLTDMTAVTATSVIAGGKNNATGGVTYVNSASGTAYTDNTVVFGNNYYYGVVASDSATQSSATSSISNINSTFPGILTPTGLTATATIGGVTLTWTAPTNSTATTLYFVFRATGGTATLITISPGNIPGQIAAGPGSVWNGAVTYVGQTTTAGVKSYTDYSVADGTTYYYTVARGDDNGATSSATSNQAAPQSATPLAETAPTSVNVVQGVSGATVTWTNSTSHTTSTRYYVFRAGDSTSLTGLTAANATTAIAAGAGMTTGSVTYLNQTAGLTLTDNSGVGGTQYFYGVVASDSATNSSATSPMSNVPSLTFVVTPGQPGAVTAVGGAGQINLSWSAAANSPAGYYVFRATVPTDLPAAGSNPTTSYSSGTGVYIGAASVTSYTDYTMTDGTTYYYAVSATNAAGLGNPTGGGDASSAGPTPTAIALPATGSYDSGAGGVVLTSASYAGGTAQSTNVGSPAGGWAGHAQAWYAIAMTANCTYQITYTVTSGNAMVSTQRSLTNDGSQRDWKNPSSATAQFNHTPAVNETLYIICSQTALDPQPNGGVNVPGQLTIVATALAGPNPVTATAVSGAITLSWSPVLGADRYYIYRATTAGALPTTSQTPTTNTTNYPSYLVDTAVGTGLTATYTDQSMAFGQTYYYAVSAVYSGGGPLHGLTSSPSNSVQTAASTSITIATTATTYNAIVTVTVSTLPAAGSPTGTITLTDTSSNTIVGVLPLTAATSSTSSATFTFSRATSGSPTLSASYAPDTTAFVSSTAAQAVTVNLPPPLTVSATPLAGTMSPSCYFGAAAASNLASPASNSGWLGHQQIWYAVTLSQGTSYSFTFTGAPIAPSPTATENTILSLQDSTGTQVQFTNGVPTSQCVYTPTSSNAGSFILIASRNSPNQTDAAFNFTLTVAVLGPPINPSATGSAGQVTLNWTGTQGASSYNIYRSLTPGGEGTTVYANVTGTTYTDTGTSGTSPLASGTTYYYTVAGVNSGTSTQAAGISVPSSEASAMTLPSAPTVSATPGNGQIALSWTASAGASSYIIARGTTSGGEVNVGTSTTTMYTDSGLSNGTTYYYTVAPVDAAGTGSASSEISAAPIAPLMITPVMVPVSQGGTLTQTSYQGSAASTSMSLAMWTPQGTYQDWYSVTLNEGSTYVISVQSTGNTFLSIQDDSGNQVAYNDDAGLAMLGSTLASQVVFTPAATGTYLVICTTEQHATPITYTLTIPNPDPVATPITVPWSSTQTLTAASYYGVNATASMSSPAGGWVDHQQDWYLLPMTAGDTYTITMALTGPGTAVLSLQGSDGTQVAYNSAGTTAQIIYMPPASGTFTVICSQSIATFATTGYTLTIPTPVLPATTSISITAAPILYPSNGTVTIAVTSTSSNTAMGTVTLSVDGGPGVTQTLGGGTATFSIANPMPGGHTLSVTYSGANGFLPSTATGNLAVDVPNVRLAPESDTPIAQARNVSVPNRSVATAIDSLDSSTAAP